MKIGFLFPGQGSQSVEMGKDLYENYQSFKDIYEKVKNITDIDVTEISFNDVDNKLNKTEYTQICILTMSLGILEILKQNNIQADIAAGLSLGEYTALIYSNLLEFEDGIKIVKKRGKYMQELVPDGNWSMAAVLGLEDALVEEACNKVKSGFVIPVNYNCSGQVVISGEAKAVEEAQLIAMDLGAKKVRILNTSGPFHTEKLIDASNALKKELDKINIHESKTDVVKNIDGSIYKKSDDIKDILAKHIISPVRFSKCLETMLDMGVDTFIEIGPRKNFIWICEKNAR